VQINGPPCFSGPLLCNGNFDASGEFSCPGQTAGDTICVYAMCCDGVMINQEFVVTDDGTGTMVIEVE
jgi:hypothetical protein